MTPYRFYVASKYEEAHRARRAMRALEAAGHNNLYDWTQWEPSQAALTPEQEAARLALVANSEIRAAALAHFIVWFPHEHSKAAYAEIGAGLACNAVVYAVVPKLPDWHMIFFSHAMLHFIVQEGDELPPAFLADPYYYWRTGGVQKYDHRAVRGVVRHSLKTLNPSFQDIWSGVKTFDVRIADREYRVGDILDLSEYEGGEGSLRWTGRSISKVVSYIVQGPAYGLPGNFVTLGLAQTVGVIVVNPTPPPGLI